jgi:hypothetical protein
MSSQTKKYKNKHYRHLAVKSSPNLNVRYEPAEMPSGCGLEIRVPDRQLHMFPLHFLGIVIWEEHDGSFLINSKFYYAFRKRENSLVIVI